MKKTLLILLASLLALAGVFLFYRKVYLPKISYRHVHPLVAEMNRTVFGIGTVDARRIYAVSGNYGGKLLHVDAQVNDRVHKGERLACFDPADLPDQIEAAKTLVQKAADEVNASVSELSALKAQEELAARTYRRAELLHAKMANSQADYDKARSDLQVLRAQVAAAKARLASSRSQMLYARADLRALQERLKRFCVEAPVDGIVVERDGEAGQTLAASQPIFRIVRPRDVWAKIYIDESLAGKLSLGQKARIRLRSKPSSPLPGRIVRIEPRSDPVTEERIVEIAFDRVPMPFYLDEQAEATILLPPLHGVLTLPAEAWSRGGVWVARGGRARHVKLKLLARSAGRIAVEGLSAHADVLIPDARHAPLHEGMRVR